MTTPYVVSDPIRDCLRPRSRSARSFDVYVARWPNGLRALLQHSPQAESCVVQVNLYRQPRIRLDVEIAHTVEHLLLARLKLGSRRDLYRPLDHLGDGGAWVFPGSMCIGAHAEFRKWRSILPQLRRVFRFGHVSQKLLELEREVLRTEVHSDEVTPDEMSYSLMLNGMFPRSPSGKPTQGYSGNYLRLTLEQVQAYFKDLFRAGNTVVGITGRFNVAAALKQIDTHFGEMPNGQSRVERKEQFPKAGMHVKQKAGSKLTSICLGHPLRIREVAQQPKRDSDENIAGGFVSTIMGEMWSSVPSLRGRELGFHYLSVAQESRGGQEFQYLHGTSDVNRVNLIARCYIDLLRRLTRRGPTAAEFDAAKNTWRAWNTLESEGLRRRTINSCGALFSDNQYSSYAAYGKRIRRISYEDVREYCRRFLPEVGGCLAVWGNTRKYSAGKTLESFCRDA